MADPLNVVALITFLTTALVITRLMAKVRKSFQDIQALQDQLRLVIDTIPALVWTAMPDGSRDFLNQRWLEYTGLALEGGLDWGWTGSFHPDDRARFMDEWRAAVAAGAPFEHEVRMRRADGDYRWFLIRGVSLRDELGTIVKWYGTSTDVEDRKRAEEALRGQASLLSLTHDTVFVRDMNDVITYWNRGASDGSRIFRKIRDNHRMGTSNRSSHSDRMPTPVDYFRHRPTVHRFLMETADLPSFI